MNTTGIGGRSGPDSRFLTGTDTGVFRLGGAPPPAKSLRIHRSTVLIGSYGLMWLLLHLCAYVYFQQNETAAGQNPSFYAWLGLLFGQLGSVLMWPNEQGLRGWLHHLFALLLIALGSGLLSELLTGTTTQWWMALVVLVLGSKSAWWAQHRPNPFRSTNRPRRPGSFTLSQWLIFSLWLGVVSSLTTAMRSDWGPSVAVMACFGGLSLLLAIQRFALQQLFWPSNEHWPRTQNHRGWQVLDSAGVLTIILSIHAALAWGLWQHYGQEPQATLVFCLCSVAVGWQAIDLWFVEVVQTNHETGSIAAPIAWS